MRSTGTGRPAADRDAAVSADHVSGAAIALHAASSGMVTVKTMPSLSLDEVDQALQWPANYRAAGVAK